MQIAEIIRRHLGWCPKTPALRTAPAVLVVPPVIVNPAQPAGGGTGGSGRIRHGIGIATGSITALIRNRHLLWFSFLAGLAILFLTVAEGWSVTHYASIPLPYSIWIPFGDSALVVFNLQLFLIEAICLSCFTYLLAGLVLYRNADSAKKTVTIRDGFARVNAHAGPLARLSAVMALAATILFEISSQSQVLGTIKLSISLAAFHIPYAYYVPNELFSALYFSFEIMVINTVLFLLAVYVIPGIVLENKELLPALAGSFGLMRKTWREMLGCIIVFGGIVLAVAAIALLIGQSPLLLNHDYDFFLQISRGQILMTVVCYGFLLACGMLMAVGSTVAGIAITELYSCGAATPSAGIPEKTQPVQTTE